MPLTSTTISGRRSFGGANVEIEKLNDPSSHQDLPAGAAAEKGESKSQMKKRLKEEKERETVNVRGGGGKGKGAASTLSSAKTGKRTAQLDQERVTGSAKKRRLAAEGGAGVAEGREGMDAMRWEADDDVVAFSSSKPKKQRELNDAEKAALTRKNEFARPAGFDGAKKGGKKDGKGKGVMGDYKWGKKGEEREWDAGKESSASSDDSEDDSEASSEEDLEEDEDEALFAAYDREAGLSEDGQVEEDVKPAGRKGGKGKKGEKGRAVQREEERFVAGGGKKGGRKGGRR